MTSNDKQLWSPLTASQLAGLAGVTRRTIGHYHREGLLPEPRRQPNGYRVYEVDDLTRLLRIRRLVSLGFSLESIASMLDSDVDSNDEPLLLLDAELQSQINRLTKMRERIATARRGQGPIDVEPKALELAAHFPVKDQRKLAVLLSSAFSQTAQDAFDEFAAGNPNDFSDIVEEFEALPKDLDADGVNEFALRLKQRLAKGQISALIAQAGETERSTRWTRTAAHVFVGTVLSDLSAPQREVLLSALADYMSPSNST